MAGGLVCVDFGRFETCNRGSKVMLPDTVSTAAVISTSSSSSESISTAPVPCRVRLTLGKDMEVGLESGKPPVRKGPGRGKSSTHKNFATSNFGDGPSGPSNVGGLTGGAPHNEVRGHNWGWPKPQSNGVSDSGDFAPSDFIVQV